MDGELTTLLMSLLITLVEAGMAVGDGTTGVTMVGDGTIGMDPDGVGIIGTAQAGDGTVGMAQDGVGTIGTVQDGDGTVGMALVGVGVAIMAIPISMAMVIGIIIMLTMVAVEIRFTATLLHQIQGVTLLLPTAMEGVQIPMFDQPT